MEQLHKTRITNIKISFKCHENVSVKESAVVLSYHTRNNLIIKFSSYTCTILGKNHNFVNLTGLRKFEDIEKSVSELLKVSNITRANLSEIKIDNISAVFATYPGLKARIYSDNARLITLFRPPKFPGLILKINRKSCTYFNSGKCLLVGLKSEEDLKLTSCVFFNFFTEINNKQSVC